MPQTITQGNLALAERVAKLADGLRNRLEEEWPRPQKAIRDFYGVLLGELKQSGWVTTPADLVDILDGLQVRSSDEELGRKVRTLVQTARMLGFAVEPERLNAGM